MALKLSVRVDDEATPGLKKLRTKRIPKAIKATTFGLATDIQSIAKLSLVRGSKSGIVYKRRGVSHQASAPGQAPASDTGDLFNSIIVTRGKGFVDVGSTILHGLHLEEKSPSKGGRPWLQPAKDKATKGGKIPKSFNVSLRKSARR